MVFEKKTSYMLHRQSKNIHLEGTFEAELQTVITVFIEN